MNAQATPRREDLDVSVERQQALQHSIRDSSADASPYLELARIFRALNKPYEAQQVLEKAVKVISDDAQLQWELEEAQLARSLQRLVEVRDLHNRHPTPVEAANLENAQTEWANRRKQVCSKRLQRDPTQVGLCVVLAEALSELNQHQEAIAALGPALDDPEHGARANLKRGQCQQATGDDLGALKSFRAAALRRSIKPQATIKLTALRHAADLAIRLGLHATCKRYLRGVVQLSPEDATARNLLQRLESNELLEASNLELN